MKLLNGPDNVARMTVLSLSSFFCLLFSLFSLLSLSFLFSELEFSLFSLLSSLALSLFSLLSLSRLMKLLNGPDKVARTRCWSWCVRCTQILRARGFQNAHHAQLHAATAQLRPPSAAPMACV